MECAEYSSGVVTDALRAWLRIGEKVSKARILIWGKMKKRKCMNFLAHLFLAGTDPLELTGSLMGDFLRGVDRATVHPKIESGIVHHLAVDSYTDSHTTVKELKQLFSRERRRYAGIILDVTFDHFLLVHWNRFSDELPLDFIHRSNRTLLDHRHLMPPMMKRIVSLLVQYEVLYSYRTIDGVQHALDRIGERFSRKVPLGGSVAEIRSNYGQIESGFLEFFPELITRFGSGKVL